MAGLVLGYPRAGSAQPEDGEISAYEQRQGWFSRDKGYHLTVSAAGSAGIYVVGREAGLRRVPAAAGAAIIMGIAGFLREAHDPMEADRLLSGGRFSRRDMVWNSIGIAVGIGLSDRIWRARRESEGTREPVTPVEPSIADAPAAGGHGAADPR